MGIRHFEIDNYEADDIIGTVARIVDEEDQFIATIVSSDKDLLQLISDEVDVKLLKTSGFIRMDKQEFIDYIGNVLWEKDLSYEDVKFLENYDPRNQED